MFLLCSCDSSVASGSSPRRESPFCSGHTWLQGLAGLSELPPGKRPFSIPFFLRTQFPTFCAFLNVRFRVFLFRVLLSFFFVLSSVFLLRFSFSTTFHNFHFVVYLVRLLNCVFYYYFLWRARESCWLTCLPHHTNLGHAHMSLLINASSFTVWVLLYASPDNGATEWSNIILLIFQITIPPTCHRKK